MAKNNSKQDYFPLKPDAPAGFKEPVAWFGGRELLSSLKGIIIYSIYGENIDPRSWMKADIFPPADVKNQPVEEIQPGAEIINKAWKNRISESEQWKSEYFQFWDDYLQHRRNLQAGRANENEDTLQEFWFDYIADSGDGQTGVYGVGCLCYSDLWLGKNAAGETIVKFAPPAKIEFDAATLLPRGSFLFVGGDTAYHVADYSTIHERFQNPFRWAFADVRKFAALNYGLKPPAAVNADGFGAIKVTNGAIETAGDAWKNWDGMISEPGFWDTQPVRPLFGVPANHDYYDDIDGFNRQFRRPPFNNLAENKMDARFSGGNPLALPSFQREQEASYTALHLPFDWWLFGIDSENEKLDFRQRVFYRELMAKWKPKKIILATPEPTTVFGRLCDPEDKTAAYLKEITAPIGLEQPFLKDGKLIPLPEKNAAGTFEKGKYCRLDLSGDVHHYARYWGPVPDNTEETKFSSDHYASLVAGGGGAFFDPTETLIGQSEITKKGQTVKVGGEIPPQKIFPEFADSRRETANRLFDLSNIRKGGYVHLAGIVFAVIIFYGLARKPEIHDFFKNAFDASMVFSNLKSLYPALYLLLSAAIYGYGGYYLHRLVTQLKEVLAQKSTDHKKGKISELQVPVLCFIVGTAVYILLFLQLQVPDQTIFSELSGYAESWLLLIHLIIAGILFWLAVEYSNWLPVRFKLFSLFKQPLDGWLDVFTSLPINRLIDGFFERRSPLISRWLLSYRKAAVENVPLFILNIAAIAVLMLGIFLFGDHPLSEIGFNLLFTLTAFGGFLGIIAFAFKTGAAYQKGKGKFIFAVIGIFHALFQLLTPFVILYKGNWIFVLAVLLLMLITNGSVIRIGRFVAARGNAALLTIAALVYGLIILVPPFFLPKGIGIDELFTGYIGRIPGIPAVWFFPNRLPLLISLLIAGYLGFRLSRVWLGWYLAISLSFNGHNNEAGGAARIEDFKHILRIKVEPEKLTVYVIGFHKAATEIKNIEPVLVDEFILKCREVG